MFPCSKPLLSQLLTLVKLLYLLKRPARQQSIPIKVPEKYDVRRLPTINLVQKSRTTLKTLMCSSPKNLYLSRRTYSDTSAELVEAVVGLTSLNTFKTVTTTREQPVNVSELLKRTARITKANCE